MMTRSRGCKDCIVSTGEITVLSVQLICSSAECQLSPGKEQRCAWLANSLLLALKTVGGRPSTPLSQPPTS